MISPHPGISFCIAAAACAVTMLAGCETPRWMPQRDGDAVVYALGPRGDVPSPLAQPLKPACPALEFAGGAFAVSAGHEKLLQELATKFGEDKKRLVIAAYAKSGLPPEYARVLTERRAHAVRQRLIELGMEPASIQTAGFGNDLPLSGPTSDVVVVFSID